MSSSAMMLRINLLPPSARKSAPSLIEQLHRTPIMWIAGVILAVIPIGLWFPVHLRRQQLHQLTTAIEMLQPKKIQMDKLQHSLQELRAEEGAFRSLGKVQSFWSKRLNTLSDATPEGVWFTDLSLDPTKGLVIQGSAVGQADPDMVNITRLVQGLKADPDFASAVKDIQIESIKRIQDGEVEIVQFSLSCALLEAASP